MGLDDFSHWQNQTVTVYAYSGFDAYGSPSVSTAGTTYAAIVVQQVKSIRDKSGADKVSNTQIYLDGSVDVHIEDTITLPDGTQPIILGVQAYPDFEGNNVLTEVFT